MKTMLRSALCLLLPAFALSVQAGTKVEPGGIRMEEEANAPALPGDVSDELEASAESKNEFVIAPLPSHSPLLGWTLSVPAMYMYKPAGSAPDDRVWISSLIGFYAENESWGVGAFQRMSLGGDKWRLSGSLFHADINYDYYGIGNEGDNDPIPLNQPMDLAVAEALYRVWHPDLYLGLKAVYLEARVSLNVDGPLPPPFPPELDPGELSQDFNLVALAPRLQFDTRDSEFYPTDGLLIEGTISIGLEALGSDEDYEKYILELNRYSALGERGVLALRVDTEYASSDSPFFIYPAFGSKSDLRGYQTGTFRDQFLIATQAEYRHRFTKRIGAVVFAGVGTVAPELFEWGTTLPSIGAGFRYVLAEKNNLALRVDGAVGKDDKQFYVGIGEAF